MPVLKAFLQDCKLCVCLQVHVTLREQVPWFRTRMTVGNGGLQGCRANQPVELLGVVLASQAIKSRQPSSGDLGVGLRLGGTGYY